MSEQKFSSDGLLKPMDREQFEHWLALHGAMPVGSPREVYQASGDLAWKAYKRGRDDQRKLP